MTLAFTPGHYPSHRSGGRIEVRSADSARPESINPAVRVTTLLGELRFPTRT